jgi:hypothetical protein
MSKIGHLITAFQEVNQGYDPSTLISTYQSASQSECAGCPSLKARLGDLPTPSTWETPLSQSKKNNRPLGTGVEILGKLRYFYCM